MTYATENPPAQAADDGACFAQSHKSLLWYQASIERKMLHYQIYASAISQLEEQVNKQQLEPDTWGVILDLDYVILDTSWADLSLISKDEPTFQETMTQYRNDTKSSMPIPGVNSFLSAVRKLGGYISIVTNRDRSVKITTIYTLKRCGITYDQILFLPHSSKTTSLYLNDKTSRFNAIINGKLPSKLPKHSIIMFVGDSIDDFPDFPFNDHEQQIKKFGKDYILLPNPINGVWAKNCLSAKSDK